MRRGDLFALLAAASNGSIGVFNRYGFDSETSYAGLAFFKCFGAFLVLSVVAGVRPRIAAEVRARKNIVGKIGILAFCGIFVLYFFETWAFSLTLIPVVAFLTYASGIAAIGLGAVFLRERITVGKAASIALVFAGVAQMFGSLAALPSETTWAWLAILGGLGYSLFLFLWKRFAVPGGLGTLWWFFGFGSVFLAVPFVWGGAPLPQGNSWVSLAGLILLPTLGGYYFTGRALTLTEASRVQILETSDPLFASVFAYAWFGEVLSPRGWVGAAAIFLGIVWLVLAPAGRTAR